MKKKAPGLTTVSATPVSSQPRGKRTADEPNFSAGGLWRGLLGSDPRSGEWIRERCQIPDLRGLQPATEDVPHHIITEHLLEGDPHHLRMMLIASLTREGERIEHTSRLDEILSNLISMIRTELQRTKALAGTSTLRNIHQILDRAEMRAGEVGTKPLVKEDDELVEEGT